MRSTLLKLLFSFPCPLCKNADPSQAIDNDFCESCFRTFPQVYGPFCVGCGGHLDTALDVCRSCLSQAKRPWQNAMTLFNHEEPMQNIIHQFKYRGMTVYARGFGYFGAKVVRERLTSLPDVIVPIPLHWFRFLQRGYNQADVWAKVLSEYLEIPVAYPLRRPHYRKHQMRLNRSGRLRKKSQIFALRNQGESVKGKHVLLVDDVFTTGATLTAAARLLKKAKVASITVFTITRR